ncbi:protein of unknown function [Evansella caseinilytica]|uniref:Uncharacterized protein n=1 Tax=Evansella caseinilytica TaxID=1503961 RepID=A0A1H3SWY1_9BACI|nr:DUF4173 domain-containing protein [Evansella caseinilytica]SDZ41619.1 protein of unknown function [Evansella caseinilytica]
MSSKKQWIIFGGCFMLAVLADVCLFQESPGISYSLFFAVFYTVFFIVFRNSSFQHKQISGMLFLAVVVLALTFAVDAETIFRPLNFLLIPLLVFFQTILLTSSSSIYWYERPFLVLAVKKLGQMFHCLEVVTQYNARKTKRKLDEDAYQKGKKIGLGVIISIPLLIVIMLLLTSADAEFARIIFWIPKAVLPLSADGFWRILIIAVLTVSFFCFFKVVAKTTAVKATGQKAGEFSWDSLVATTVLLFVNIVYLLFAIVQFQYFFSGTLQEGFSYAEYARRGFAELLIVTVINYGILLGTMKRVNMNASRVMKGLLTFLIAFSGILLSSAFIRLMLYEQAYGFTYLRVLAHAFMIYLFIVFAFTLVKVWAERLSLARFYIIFTVVFYVGLNLIGIDKFIVTKNIERYELTEKIDVEYLSELSAAAVPSLVALYQEHPDIPGLEAMLEEKVQQYHSEKIAWQSFYLTRSWAIKALHEIID